jgi:hypothetical protein
MSTNNIFKSDLYDIHNIVQAFILVYPKEMIISTLRDFFLKIYFFFFLKILWNLYIGNKKIF